MNTTRVVDWTTAVRTRLLLIDKYIADVVGICKGSGRDMRTLPCGAMIHTKGSLWPTTVIPDRFSKVIEFEKGDAGLPSDDLFAL